MRDPRANRHELGCIASRRDAALREDRARLRIRRSRALLERRRRARLPRRLELRPLLRPVPRGSAARAPDARGLDDARRDGARSRTRAASDAWSPASRTVTRRCSRTWPSPSTTSRAAGSSSASAPHGTNRSTSPTGCDFPSAGTRIAMLDEACEIIRRLWTEEKVDHEGRFWTLKDALCSPKPVQDAHPDRDRRLRARRRRSESSRSTPTSGTRRRQRRGVHAARGDPRRALRRRRAGPGGDQAVGADVPVLERRSGARARCPVRSTRSRRSVCSMSCSRSTHRRRESSSRHLRRADVRRAVLRLGGDARPSAALARRTRSVPDPRQRSDAPADASRARRTAVRALPRTVPDRRRIWHGRRAADVLRAWQNLGYNRRALNLWRAAREIVNRGGFPATVDGLEALPGVGPYTARAVASFAFDVDVAASSTRTCDGWSRVSAAASGRGRSRSRATRSCRAGRAAVWNQAMIDLGAEVCRAGNARCADCPLRSGCAWNRGERIAPPSVVERPRSSRRRATREDVSSRSCARRSSR